MPPPLFSLLREALAAAARRAALAAQGYKARRQEAKTIKLATRFDRLWGSDPARSMALFSEPSAQTGGASRALEFVLTQMLLSSSAESLTKLRASLAHLPPGALAPCAQACSRAFAIRFSDPVLIMGGPGAPHGSFPAAAPFDPCAPEIAMIALDAAGRLPACADADAARPARLALFARACEFACASGAPESKRAAARAIAVDCLLRQELASPGFIIAPAFPSPPPDETQSAPLLREALALLEKKGLAGAANGFSLPQNKSKSL